MPVARDILRFAAVTPVARRQLNGSVKRAELAASGPLGESRGPGRSHRSVAAQLLGGDGVPADHVRHPEQGGCLRAERCGTRGNAVIKGHPRGH